LDEKGEKMSKSKGNVVDPIEMFNKHGADCMRWLFLNTNPGNPIRFSEDSLTENIKQIILPVWNIYSFFVTYAKIDNYIPDLKQVPKPSTNSLDIWILSETKRLILEVTKALDGYDPAGGTQSINQYIDKLSNWYIRRSRRRFWKSENDDDKQHAYDTLYRVFVDLIKVIAPFLPFVTEEIYQNMVRSVDPKAPESIHLCDYPLAEEKERNLSVEHEMNLIREVVSSGRSLRNKYQIKVRQPLSELVVICHDKADENIITNMNELIKEELNVKKVIFAENEKELVDLTVKPNLKKLGPKLGKDLKKASPVIMGLNSEQINQLENNQSVTIQYDDKTLELNVDDVLIERKEKAGLLIEVSQAVTVALNSEITPELQREGFAREFVNKVQNMRKELRLDVLDRIKVEFNSTNVVKKSVEELSDYIKNETLANEIVYLSEPLDG
jgi:isoleucyl-tRNA synthetase